MHQVIFVIWNNAHASPSYPIKKRNWFARNISIAGMYHLTSNYGESYARPLIIIALALLGSTFFFLSVGTERSIEATIIRSVNSFIPFFNFPDDAKLIDYILGMILLPIGATLFIAMRRKLERRFRH